MNHFPLPLLIKLIRIDYIMPYTVETGSHGCNGSQKSISHPDGYHRILLPQCLSGTDGIVIDTADTLSYPELKPAANTEGGKHTRFP